MLTRASGMRIGFLRQTPFEASRYLRRIFSAVLRFRVPVVEGWKGDLEVPLLRGLGVGRVFVYIVRVRLWRGCRRVASWALVRREAARNIELWGGVLLCFVCLGD